MKSITFEKYVALALFIFLAVFPQFASLYTTQIFGKYITYMILALGLDILWGYGGLMDLGYAVFFGLGGYTIGISLASQNGNLPSYMTMAGIDELPLLFTPLKSLPAAVILSILLPSLLALFIGLFIFNSKIKGIFFNLITLAFASMFELLIKSNQKYTGGSSGVNGIARGLTDIQLFGHKASVTDWYYLALILLVVVYVFCLWLVNSRFGKIVKSIRDNEARVEFLGYNAARYKLILFMISGALAGLAGAMYVPMTSFISVENAGVTFSTTILVWLAVGGRGNLTGAMGGALLISVLQNQLSSLFGDIWQLIMGIILVLAVLLLPGGIIGSLLNLQLTRRMEVHNDKDQPAQQPAVAQKA